MLLLRLMVCRYDPRAITAVLTLAISAVTQFTQQPSYSAGPFRQSNATFRVGLFDRSQKALNVGCASVASFIYVERRCAGHVFIEQTLVVICFDLLEECTCRQIMGKSLDIKFDTPGIARKIVILQRLLMCEQLVVHLPEFPLRAGCLRSFSGAQRMRMSLHDGKVPKDKAQIVAQQFLNFLDYRISTTAINAFEVAILEQSYRRCCRA